MSTHKDTTSQVATRLRSLQSVRGWTISEMAKIASMSRNSLQNYMRLTNAQNPGVEAIVLMARAFDVSADWILGLSDEVPNLDTDQENHIEMVTLAAKMQITQILRSINSEYQYMGEGIFVNGKYHGVDPEILAQEFADSMARILGDLLGKGDIQETLFLIYKPEKA